jgi:hypothetical protein
MLRVGVSAGPTRQSRVQHKASPAHSALAVAQSSCLAGVGPDNPQITKHGPISGPALVRFFIGRPAASGQRRSEFDGKVCLKLQLAAAVLKTGHVL